MKRYITILTAGLLLGMNTGSRAQDIHFSQFYENEIFHNPGLTGIFSGDYKYGIDYRSQWGSVATPFNTTMLSGETRILVNREAGDYLSFGLAMTYDKAGTINFISTQIYPAIAYNKALEDVHNTYLSVGFTGGYINRNVDMSLMTFSSQYLNGSYSANNPSMETATFKGLHNYDVGAGISLNSSLDLYNNQVNYYLGAAIYHINSPTEIFSGGAVLVKLPMKVELNAGLHLPISDNFSFTAHVNYSNQHPYQELLFGGLFTWRALQVGLPSIFAFHFGLMARYQDAIIPTFKIDFKNTTLGFSYDINNSSLGSQAGGAGATEITLYVRGNYTHKKNPRDPVMCPRFEDSPNPGNTWR